MIVKDSLKNHSVFLENGQNRVLNVDIALQVRSDATGHTGIL